MAKSPSYLQLRDNTWYVVVEIPKPLREAAGGHPRYIKSLETESKTEAERLKLPYVMEFRHRVELLRKGLSDPFAKDMGQAHEFRAALSSPDNEVLYREGDAESDARTELLGVITDKAQDVVAAYGPERGALFMDISTGKATRIKDHFETWISEADVTARTRSQHGSAIKRYLAWAGEHTAIEYTDRRKAGEYVSHLLAASGLARKTIDRHLSHLSSFWTWLEAKGMTEDNPWLRHKLGKKSKKPSRTAMDDEALLKLLNGSYSTLRYRQTLRDLLRLGLLTGARLEELCALKAKDVTKRDDGYWLSITAGKTDAAVRDIPAHSLAVPIIARRLKDKDEYLFEGLIPGGPDKSRSAQVSKAYGRFRTQAGVKEQWQDFHALRHTFTSMMEGREVPESTVQLIIGHKRESLTYGHYSKGQRVQLRDAIAKMAYGPEVMKALATR